MSFVTRAASLAALTLGAALLVGTSSGSASQLAASAEAPILALNALTLEQVPSAPLDEQTLVDQATTANVRAAVADLNSTSRIADADVDADGDDYASLAAAVAAQDADADDRELRCLAAGVYFEANGEPLAGQLAVAQTILNRARSGRFANSVCGVLTQRGQFSFVRGGVVPSAEGRGGWKTAVAVAKVAQRDLWDGAADDALYFHARRVAPGWRMTRVAAIGNHVFYR